ncbi:MAG: hypothetical protein AMXMBFR53_02030 [Gemmatimonadota bacterium]
MRTPWLGACALLPLGALSGCDQTLPAYGDVTSIIAVMAPDVWASVGDDLNRGLEPTVLTVRDERTFTVTYQDPSGPAWRDLRRLRQLLRVGTGDEAWIQPALDALPVPFTDPGLYRAYDVWGSGQQAVIVLSEPGREVETVTAYLPDIHRMLDAQFRQYAVYRMFLTGPDSALADTLVRTAGFSVIVPNVYDWERGDSTYTFRNDNPDPSELIRQVTITWRSASSGGSPETGAVLAWRANLAASYREPQDVDLSMMQTGRVTGPRWEGLQIQALWVNPPAQGWPAAGPFITRWVSCGEQGRTYLLDAWLYAPGKRKYEYMIQLETILDSFRCDGPAGATARPAP